MSKLTIDLTGKGGLAPRFYGDIDTVNLNLRYLGGEDQVANGIYNPFKRYGYLSAVNTSMTNIAVDSGSPTTMISSVLYDMANDDIYMAERGQEVYRGDGLSDTDLASVLDLTATGTPRIMDLEMYMIGGSQKIFYIYEKDDNIEVGHADTGGAFANTNNDWISGITTPGTAGGDVVNPLTGQTLINDAFMRVADNGFAYLFMDNQIHKIDGTTGGGDTGTLTANVVVFPPFFQITDAIDTNGRFYISIRQDKSPSAIGITLANAPVGVYVWDRFTSSVNMQNYIAIPGIREIRKIYISPKGTIRVITINSETNVEIRELQGNVFNVIQTVGNNAYPLYLDAVNVSGLVTTWVGRNGTFYFHGQITENDKETLYNLGAITGSAPGIMFPANTGSLAFYVSDYLSTVYRLKKWNVFSADGTANIGNVYTLVKFLPAMSTVNYIDIYCRPAGTGAGTIATIKPYFNQSASAWASKAVTLDEAGTGLKRIEVGKPFINAIQLEIEFSTTVNLSGLTDFSPAFAIVDYTPTKTKG